MVSCRVKTPQLIFNPVGGVDHWVVLWSGADLRPYLFQALRAAERAVFDDVIIIVPDVITLGRWQVAGKSSCQDANTKGYLASERFGLQGIRGHGRPEQLAMGPRGDFHQAAEAREIRARIIIGEVANSGQYNPTGDPG